jgi:hypothetical protein
MMTTHDPNPLMITLGYELPFRAAAFTTPDPMLRVHVRCKPEARPKALLQLQTHVAIFLDAALFGMGAGSRVPPRLDPRSIDEVLRMTTPCPEEVMLEAPVVVDPSYVTVLLHKLLGLSELVPIDEVIVELPGLSPIREPIQIQRAEGSALPEVHQPLPFALDDERSGHADGCTVTLRYAHPPDHAQLELLREGLLAFVAQAAQGGFICPPMGPDDYFVSADDDVIAHEDEVTWTMESCDFAPDGLNGLLNFLAAYHQQAAALRGVSIE